jgi:sugar (pentulose or hexulose) kinase
MPNTLAVFSHKVIQVRAIIEGQFLSMRGHAERCGLPVPPKRIIATGGASSNQAILKIMASVFGCPVYTVQRPGMQMKFPAIYSCLVIHIALSLETKLNTMHLLDVHACGASP